jgi:large subunit ribosomal protein L32
MPLPKRQHSKTRGRTRRTHWKTTVASLKSCAQCQKPILPHRICPFCGYFKGTQIVTAKVKTPKA